MLELPSLPEVEGGTREALLEDLHHRNEHLRRDLRVEFDVLVEAEFGDLLEGLLNEILDFTLFLGPLLLVHGAGRTGTLPIVAAFSTRG